MLRARRNRYENTALPNGEADRAEGHRALAHTGQQLEKRLAFERTGRARDGQHRQRWKDVDRANHCFRRPCAQREHGQFEIVMAGESEERHGEDQRAQEARDRERGVLRGSQASRTPDRCRPRTRTSRIPPARRRCRGETATRRAARTAASGRHQPSPRRSRTRSAGSRLARLRRVRRRGLRRHDGPTAHAPQPEPHHQERRENRNCEQRRRPQGSREHVRLAEEE